VRGLALAAAIAFFTAAPGLAVEEDSNPQASARNPDYAAGKQAFDRKDWGEAVRRSPTARWGSSNWRSSTTTARSR
jgi:hypothetical protein